MTTTTNTAARAALTDERKAALTASWRQRTMAFEAEYRELGLSPIDLHHVNRSFQPDEHADFDQEIVYMYGFLDLKYAVIENVLDDVDKLDVPDAEKLTRIRDMVAGM